MMEQQKERKWHLVRNNNGEWICSEQVVYLEDFSAMIYALRAKKYGLLLSPTAVLVSDNLYQQNEVSTATVAREADQQETKKRQMKNNPVKGGTSQK